MNFEQITNWASFGVVVICWFIFAGKILLSKKPKSGPDAKRAPLSWVGLVLQGAAFFLIWATPRKPYFSSLIDGQPETNILLQLIAILLSIISVFLAISAVNELGKQWSIAARLIEGHNLITSGAYSIVRHPIYTALLVMIISTGLAFSHFLALAAAIMIFVIGTKIRINAEESLLRDAFGEEFGKWKAKVPGLLPFMKS